MTASEYCRALFSRKCASRLSFPVKISEGETDGERPFFFLIAVGGSRDDLNEMAVSVQSTAQLGEEHLLARREFGE